MILGNRTADPVVRFQITNQVKRPQFQLQIVLQNPYEMVHIPAFSCIDMHDNSDRLFLSETPLPMRCSKDFNRTLFSKSHP